MLKPLWGAALVWAAISLAGIGCTDGGVAPLPDAAMFDPRGEDIASIERWADDGRYMFLEYDGLTSLGERNSCVPNMAIDTVGVGDCLQWKPLTVYQGTVVTHWEHAEADAEHAGHPLIVDGDRLPLGEPIIIMAFLANVPGALTCEIGGSQMQPESDAYLHVNGVLGSEHLTIDEVASILDERIDGDTDSELAEGGAARYVEQCSL